MIKTTSGILLFLFQLSIANASLITFEPPPCLGCPSQVSSYAEGGILFTGNFGHHNTALPGSAGNGSAGSARLPFMGRMTIQQSDGGPFSLHVVELGEYSTSFAGVPKRITFTGTRADATVVQQIFTIDGIIGNGTNDFESFAFSGFRDLLRVDVSGEMIAMDNLSINAVPVPPAAWLFLSGLLGLVAATRRSA
jgi:hypothetical protein